MNSLKVKSKLILDKLNEEFYVVNFSDENYVISKKLGGGFVPLKIHALRNPVLLYWNSLYQKFDSLGNVCSLNVPESFLFELETFEDFSKKYKFKETKKGIANESFLYKIGEFFSSFPRIMAFADGTSTVLKN